MAGSKGIAVERFRQVLIWPLAVARPSGRNPGWTSMREVGRQVRGLAAPEGNPWQPIEDGLQYLDGRDDEKFQEFVYFHDFVGRFLYADSKDGKRALHIFRRDDVHRVSVTLPEGQGSFDLSVDRVHLYLFDIGVAALVVEVSAPDNSESDTDGFHLGDVMNLSDRFRRVYPPHWKKPGGFPEQVLWGSEDGDDLFGLKARGWTKQNYTDHVTRHCHASRHAPVAPHWRALIEPLAIEGHDCRVDGSCIADDTPRWRHVVDERIPVMNYIGASCITEVSRADWIRLCFVDPSGDGWPYAERFLDDFERDHAYDRFWDRSGKDIMQRTRYLFAGYAMVMATANDEFARENLEVHFRRHYFQLGLIVHLQMAALLALSDQISRAVADYESNQKDGLGEFEYRIAALNGELLRFTHRYWFTGVSNQVQAREIYDLWRERLNVQGLYAEVANEAREADQYLTLKRQDRIADDNKRLTEIAAVGLPMALAVGFLGMNLIVGQTGGWPDWCSSTHWSQVLAVLCFFSVSGACLTGLLYRSGTPPRGGLGFVRWVRPPVLVLLGVGVTCLLLLGVVLSTGDFPARFEWCA